MSVQNKNKYGEFSGTKKLQKAKPSKRKDLDKSRLTEFSENYDQVLESITELIEVEREEFDDYLDSINEEIESYDEEFLNGRKVLDIPSDKKTMYEFQTQMTELVNFIMTLKPTDENISEVLMSARSMYIESYIKDRRHVSTSNPHLEEQFEKVEYFRNLEDMTEGIEGVGQCTICGGSKIIIKSRQTRSADEAATITYNCGNCKASGKYIRLSKEKETESGREIPIGDNGPDKFCEE